MGWHPGWCGRRWGHIGYCCGFSSITSSRQNKVHIGRIVYPAQSLPIGSSVPGPLLRKAGMREVPGSKARNIYWVTSDCPLTTWISQLHSIRQAVIIRVCFAESRRPLEAGICKSLPEHGERSSAILRMVTEGVVLREERRVRNRRNKLRPRCALKEKTRHHHQVGYKHRRRPRGVRHQGEADRLSARSADPDLF